MNEQSIIREISVDTTGDVTFYFSDSDTPYNSREFVKDTKTRARLENIEREISRFNGRPVRPPWNTERFLRSTLFPLVVIVILVFIARLFLG